MQNVIQPKIILSYTDANELRVLDIWYNAEKNEFSINYIPDYNIKTENGTLEGHYWLFNGDSPISYTIEPFIDMPENYQKY